MKEKQSFKRFDLFSVLAGAGILLVLLFESYFIFELYEVNLFRKNPAGLESTVQPPVSSEPVPVEPGETVPVG